ncbi:MAG: hypothetical protein ACRBC3_08765 [Burkholderiaceae bacterium]
MSRRAILLGCLVFAGLGIFQTPASAQSFYPMVCRGGGDMLMSLSFGPRGQKIIELRFRRGLTAYSPASLHAGECTWTDRPLNSREPERFLHVTSAPISVYLWANYSDRAHTTLDSNATDWPTRLARRFLTETRKPGLFTIWARNTRAGYFEISNVRAGD